MIKERNCEYCNEEFKPRNKRQVGRFCSSLCNRKLLRQNQLKKYNEYLSQETSEQKTEWLREHYERFVIKNKNDCWDWVGHKKQDGYAVLNHRGKIMTAHRISWILNNGNIPSNTFVLHKCDVRHCSRPDHLFIGNHTDNMKDMASKYRTGVRCKLTIDQVYEIKNLINLGVSMPKLAKKYNVSTNSIWEIKSGRSWKHTA